MGTVNTITLRFDTLGKPPDEANGAAAISFDETILPMRGSSRAPSCRHRLAGCGATEDM